MLLKKKFFYSIITTVRLIRIDVCPVLHTCINISSPKYHPYISKRLNVFRVVMVLLTTDWFGERIDRHGRRAFFVPICLDPGFLLPWQRGWVQIDRATINIDFPTFLLSEVMPQRLSLKYFSSFRRHWYSFQSSCLEDESVTALSV